MEPCLARGKELFHQNLSGSQNVHSTEESKVKKIPVENRHRVWLSRFFSRQRKVQKVEYKVEEAQVARAERKKLHGSASVKSR